MTFVDDDVTQIAQKDRPPGVVAQQRQVDHVGIGEDPPRPFAGEPPYLAGAVTVVRAGCDRGQLGHRVGERLRRPQLVVAKGLGRRQIQRARTGVGGECREDGQLIRQRLARMPCRC